MWKIYALLTTAMLIWGFNLPLLKYLLIYVGPVTMTTFRILLAGVSVFIILGSIQNATSANQNRMEIHNRRRDAQRRPPSLLPEHGTFPHIRYKCRTYTRPRSRPNSDFSFSNHAYLTHLKCNGSASSSALAASAPSSSQVGESAVSHSATYSYSSQSRHKCYHS